MEDGIGFIHSPSSILYLRFPNRYSIAHGPGPPQRPHMGRLPPAGDLPDPSDDTAAKTLSARAVLSDSHVGHLAGSADEVIVRTSFSNRAPHCLHSYS
jgi:hypothetical protein